MAGKEAIKFLRGTSTKRLASTATLSAGQPFYETDTNKLYIGEDNALNSAVPIVATPDTHCHTYLTDADQCNIYIDDGASIEFTYNDVHQGTDMSTRNWYIHYGGTAGFASMYVNNDIRANSVTTAGNISCNGHLEASSANIAADLNIEGQLTLNGYPLSSEYLVHINIQYEQSYEDGYPPTYLIQIKTNKQVNSLESLKTYLNNTYYSNKYVVLPCVVSHVIDQNNPVIALVYMPGLGFKMYCADGTVEEALFGEQNSDALWIYYIDCKTL